MTTTPTDDKFQARNLDDVLRSLLALDYPSIKALQEELQPISVKAFFAPPEAATEYWVAASVAFAKHLPLDIAAWDVGHNHAFGILYNEPQFFPNASA